MSFPSNIAWFGRSSTRRCSTYQLQRVALLKDHRPFYAGLLRHDHSWQSPSSGNQDKYKPDVLLKILSYSNSKSTDPLKGSKHAVEDEDVPGVFWFCRQRAGLAWLLWRSASPSVKISSLRTPGRVRWFRNVLSVRHTKCGPPHFARHLRWNRQYSNAILRVGCGNTVIATPFLNDIRGGLRGILIA